MLKRTPSCPKETHTASSKVVVFQGNRVVNQDWMEAIFQDLGSTPAGLEASRWTDAHGCLEGHDTQIADAVQAYSGRVERESVLGCMPPEAWPSEWIGKYHSPVVRLVKASRRHPDNGTMWEKHCDAHLKTVGFDPVPSWSSTYFHKILNLFLVVCVDDLELSGPSGNSGSGMGIDQARVNG